MFNKFRYLMVAHFQELAEYRTDLLIYTFSALVLPFVLLNVWFAVAESSHATVEEQRYIVSYFLVQMIVNLIVSAWHSYFFGTKIKDGLLSQYLLKPFSYLWYDVSENVTEKVWKLLLALPTVAVMWYLWREFIIIPSPIHVVFFFFTLILAAGIRLMIEHLLALTAFWSASNIALEQFNDMVFMFASGMLFPLKYLTNPIVKHIVDLLPYKYIVNFPINVYLGVTSSGELIEGMLFQCMWLVVLTVLVVSMWRKGLQVYASFGG